MNLRPTLKVLFLALACCVALSFASTATRNSEAPAADDKRQLQDLEKSWVAAEAKHGVTTVRRILDDKFVASFGAGKPYDKEAFLKQIGTGDVDPTESQTLSDWSAIIDADTSRGWNGHGAGDRERARRIQRFTDTRRHTSVATSSG